MPASPPDDGGRRVTQALRAVNRGESGASDRLLTLVYDDLYRLARARLQRLRPGQTLQTTAIVDDAWMRVVGGGDADWESRRHFFGAASRAMRNILVEEARRRLADKRGGGRDRATGVDVAQIACAMRPTDLVALDEALDRLEVAHPRKARAVMLRFFGGLENREVADLMEVSLATVERDWRFARAWLQRQVKRAHTPEGSET